MISYVHMKESSKTGLGATPESNAIARKIVDNIDAMVAYWDNDRVCRFANDAYRKWFGRSCDQVIGLTMQQLLAPVFEKNLPYIHRAYAGTTLNESGT